MIQGVITLIISDSTCQTLIGQSGSTYKVFPTVAPQDTAKPYVTIRRTGELSAIVKNEASQLDTPVINITAYAKEYKTAYDILAAIRTVIDNYEGTSESVVYKKVWYINSQDMFDKEDDSHVIIDTYNARVSR